MVPEIIFKIGGLAGLISIMWLTIKDIITFLKRPKLNILPFDATKDLRTFNYYDTGWIRKFANLHIKNGKPKTAINSLAILRVVSSPSNVVHLERQYNLHWADVDYSMRTVEPQSVNIGRGQRRLDIVFSQKGQRIPGCWVAIPLALSQVHLRQNQAYLPPGEYEVEVAISCENGGGDKRQYKIISPEEWLNLSMMEMKG